MRQTEEAYKKGLVQGYALAKAQYEELLRAYQFRSDTDDPIKVQSKDFSEES